ncbi:MAG: hypothetical protein AUJ52_09350 [Elusimicrobia bacterium CG1_02_63_36]|nr:MAG: hypothetical protein AUJ52_09350 [Elusimicrobia bacterium CG1_02_63_36]
MSDSPQGSGVVDKPFPEIGSSMDPAVIPWIDSVVWSERSVAGRRVYEWLTKEHVRRVSWNQGVVSLEVADASFLARDVMYFVIQAPFVAVGRNLPV